MVVDVIWPYPMLILGLVILVKGADILVSGSSSLAKRLGISSLFIGLTIVAFGTSLPEFMVNFFSAVKGTTDIAIGNIVGSNIANLLLILGAAAVIMPVTIKYSTVWKEVPFSLLAAFTILVLFNDHVLNSGVGGNVLSRGDGIILLFFFAIFLYYAYELMKSTRTLDESTSLEIKRYSRLKVWALIIAGLIGVSVGGKMIVESAVAITTMIGVSEIFISATVVAIGTSLPELATAIAAAIKGDPSLAVGNVVGSNIFNIFLVLGATSALRPIPYVLALNADLLFLVAVSLLFFGLVLVGKKYKLEKWHGITFLALYACYIGFMIYRG